MFKLHRLQTFSNALFRTWLYIHTTSTGFERRAVPLRQLSLLSKFVHLETPCSKVVTKGPPNLIHVAKLTCEIFVIPCWLTLVKSSGILRRFSEHMSLRCWQYTGRQQFVTRKHCTWYEHVDVITVCTHTNSQTLFELTAYDMHSRCFHQVASFCRFE